MHERTAVLRCQVVDRFDRGHGPEEFRMPMTQVWVRHDDGRWVCLAGHAGPRTRLIATVLPGFDRQCREVDQSTDDFSLLHGSDSIARSDYFGVSARQT